MPVGGIFNGRIKKRIMMKKNYLKPEAFELAVVIDNIMAQTSTPVDNEENDNQGDFGAGKNRGEWGSVWK